MGRVDGVREGVGWMGSVRDGVSGVGGWCETVGGWERMCGMDGWNNFQVWN